MVSQQFNVSGMSCDGTWSIPEPASLDTARNCTLYSNFVVSVLRNAYKSTNDTTYDMQLCQASPQDAYAFVVGSLANGSALPSMCQFAVSYFADQGPFCMGSNNAGSSLEYQKKLLYDPLETCRSDLKASMGLEINLDIAGIGLMALARRSSKACNGWPTRIAGSVRNTVSALFSGSLVLGYSVVIASLATYLRTPPDDQLIEAWVRGADVNMYENPSIFLASGVSFFSVLCLHSIISNPRRKNLRHVLVVLLYLLYTGLACWTGLTTSGPTESNMSTAVFDEPQSATWMRFIGDNYAKIIMVLLLGGPGLMALVALVVARLRSSKRTQWWCLPRHYKQHLWIITGLVSYTMMFVCIALLAYLRNQATDDIKGETQSEWKFGQIIPLFTWVPVIIEWCYMFVFGIETGLEGNMPKEYDARYNGKAEGTDAGTQKYQYATAVSHFKDAIYRVDGVTTDP
ncbi:hypothetical protein PFICI_04510 [Pestalotiopsis fici W106-1]|uniref:Uncharacterized protein n=1 Tax=Pestalotiopsis fici (strain W106-1 / CGMCC3.15140) TaxID=1229662 RepID=W3X9B7_PESFW|nr:uncharacterized protein PFICI_04510 [Pestalotiopsis fici W106-1]ETS82634.1 hypothetical protein PFICI_04510 [Pestalotiopsis fici W106-1]